VISSKSNHPQEGPPQDGTSERRSTGLATKSNARPRHTPQRSPRFRIRDDDHGDLQALALNETQYFEAATAIHHQIAQHGVKSLRAKERRRLSSPLATFTSTGSASR